MKYAKYLLLVLLAIAVFTITACEEAEEKIKQGDQTTPKLVVGIDEHGCDPAEGYTYCPTTAGCLRVWETHCPKYEEYYREPTFCTMEYAPVTGEITFPCDEGKCTITEKFGNRCVAESAGAKNIKPINIDDEVINDNQNTYDLCTEKGGIPLRDFNECEKITKNDCKSLGGEFLECESACRNLPYDPEIACIEVCVEVCRFN